jgi:hypothetical protein
MRRLPGAVARFALLGRDRETLRRLGAARLGHGRQPLPRAPRLGERPQRIASFEGLHALAERVARRQRFVDRVRRVIHFGASAIERGGIREDGVDGRREARRHVRERLDHAGQVAPIALSGMHALRRLQHVGFGAQRLHLDAERELARARFLGIHAVRLDRLHGQPRAGALPHRLGRGRMLGDGTQRLVIVDAIDRFERQLGWTVADGDGAQHAHVLDTRERGMADS